MDSLQPVKEFIREKLHEYQRQLNIDPHDRKVQVAAGASLVTAIYLYMKLTTRRNFWDEMPPHKPATANTIADDRMTSQLERCSEPSEMLQICVADSGPASMEPLTVLELWNEAARNGGDRPCFGWEEEQEDGTWKYVFTSWKEAGIEYRKIARALIGLKVKRFDVCNIIGGCTPMFHKLFWGIMFAGSIPGGCYTTNNSGALEHIANLCKTKVVFAENVFQLSKYLEVADTLKTVQYIVVYDDDGFDSKDPKYSNLKKIKLMNFSEFMAFESVQGTDVEQEKREKAANPRQCACLIYTSGTTGGSKGCMLSHDNIVFAFASATETYLSSGGQYPDHVRMVSYLPLSHIAGQGLSWWQAVYLMAKMNMWQTTYYCRSDWKKTVKFSMKSAKPTAFVSVPRMYEKFYEKLMAKMATASMLKRGMFQLVQWYGRDYYYNTQAGGSGQIPLLWKWISKNICDLKIKKEMGFQECHQFGSGGAPLAPNIRETFACLNMPIVDLYGLSETAGAICLSRANNYVVGACGPVMMGSELVIEHKSGRDEKGHGEICYRGRSAMMGYIHEIEKTNKTFDDDGFFHTGDVGYIDDYDCLHITGRIKELLVTAGGENIAPVPVENYIKEQCPALSQAIMIGDKKKYCSMLVSIACKMDKEDNPSSELEAHAKLINANVSTVEEAMTDEVWHQYIRAGIKKYNADKSICVSNSCKIQYFQILHKDLSVADGTLSASQKLKRHKLQEVYRVELDALYADKPAIAVSPRM